MRYAIINFLIKAVSRLPLWLLYLKADFLYILLYYVFGYRKYVVRHNLKNAFPEWEFSQIEETTRAYYRHLSDIIVETIKLQTIKPTKLKQMISFAGNDIFEELLAKNQHIISAMGHCGNWELSGSRFELENLHHLLVVYKPIKDKALNKIMVQGRTRFGNSLIPMHKVAREMLTPKEKPVAYGLIADQSPGPKNAYWTTFLNQETAVFRGTAKLAIKFNYPIVYSSIFKEKRGQYKIDNELLIASPQLHTEEYILEKYMQRLEQDIIKQPFNWLWSHKRWKHNKM